MCSWDYRFARVSWSRNFGIVLQFVETAVGNDVARGNSCNFGSATVRYTWLYIF